MSIVLLINKKNTIWGLNTPNSVLSIVLLFFFTSCKFFAKTFYGVRNPKAESEKTILKFLEKHRINSDNIFIFKHFKSYMEAINNQKKLTFIKIFSKNGVLLAQSVSKGCDAGVVNYIRKYGSADATKRYELERNNFTNSEQLQEILDNLISVSGKTAKIDSINKDLHILCYYANFQGKIAKLSIKDLKKEISKTPLKVNLWLVNCDVRQEWNDSLKLNLKTAR